MTSGHDQRAEPMDTGGGRVARGYGVGRAVAGGGEAELGRNDGSLVFGAAVSASIAT